MANFFSLALSIHLWYNEVNERGDFMEIKEAEAIKAADIKAILWRCTLSRLYF